MSEVIAASTSQKTIRAISDEGFSFAVGGIEEDTAILDNVHVDAPVRGQKLGSRLIQAFKKDAKAKGARRIVGTLKPEFGLNLQKTREFYEKNGFRVDDDQITCDL